ncbi:4-coumarate--CoA ligase 3 [Aphelenchoides besseyi]|nr:4-coumarate--CoA ligase 3 [Aphelenchoides besseyi]
MPQKSSFPNVPIDPRPFSEQFLQRIWTHSCHNPQKPALINAHNPSDWISYRDLFVYSQSVATFLRSIGFGHRDIALIAAPNCWEYMVIFGGVGSTGGALSGCPYLFTECMIISFIHNTNFIDELQRQILDCGASVVFCAESLLGKMKVAIKKCPKVKILIVIPEKPVTKFTDKNVYSFADVIRTEPKCDFSVKYDVTKDPILIPYSSGTTGIPKGVLLTHRNISATIGAIDVVYNTNIFPKAGISGSISDATFLLIMPFYHVYGNSVCLHGLVNGTTALVMKSFEPELFCSTIQKYKIRIIKLVPPIMVFLAKSPVVDKYDLSSVQVITSGAAPMGTDLALEVRKRLPHLKYISQGYGMSEASVASHFPHLSEELNAAACGLLMPNMEQMIVDVKTGKELTKPGERGEIVVRGPNIMLGYLNRPKETAATIRNGWLHTGDIGYVDEQGLLYIVDRLKELIKVKGLQVPPAELEDLLLSHPRIADAAVIGVKDEKAGELPKAFVVRKDESLTEKEVFDFVAERVAHYKQLKGGVQFLQTIPRSAAGKILKIELKERSPKL